VSIRLAGTLQIKGLPIELTLLSMLTSSLAEVVAETVGDVFNCRALNVPSWLWLFWTVFLIFECLLCYLAISKVYNQIKSQSPYAQDGLHNVLLRNFALYYISCVLLFIDLSDQCLNSGTGLPRSIPSTCISG
jgi:hypothetical protein